MEPSLSYSIGKIHLQKLKVAQLIETLFTFMEP
jgi:hypothetical protein